MKTKLVKSMEYGLNYDSLGFVCPGCISSNSRSSGLHILPINTNLREPAWTWDGDLIRPTLSPSILTRGSNRGTPTICHSFLKAGFFEFLSDCTHSLAGQTVEIPDLPVWFVKEREQ